MGTSTFRLHIFLCFLQWVCMVFITLKKSLLFGKNSGLAKGRKKAINRGGLKSLSRKHSRRLEEGRGRGVQARRIRLVV